MAPSSSKVSYTHLENGINITRETNNKRINDIDKSSLVNKRILPNKKLNKSVLLLENNEWIMIPSAIVEV